MRRFFGGFSVAAAIGVAAVSVPTSAFGLSPYLEKPDPAEAMKTPAYRYANMTDDEAYAELDARGILYSRERSVVGVRAPIRLTGRLHGVLIRSVLPPEERATSMFEILDARLALALDDFAVLLASHDVDEVVHYTMYRPNVPKPGEEGDTDAIDKDHGKKGDSTNGDGKSKPHVSESGKKKPAAASEKKPAAPQKKPATIDKKATKPGKMTGTPTNRARQKQPGELDRVRKLPRIDDGDVDAPALGADLTIGENLLEVDQVGAKPAPKKRPPSGSPQRRTAKKATSKRSTRIVTASAKPTIEKGADDDKPRGKWAPPGTRHPAGLAIDVGILKKKDGTQLSVAAHFDGTIGAQTCGKGAPEPTGADAKELRDIVCGAHDAGIFTYTLTPNFDLAHKDHFHMEIKPGVTWFLYQ